MFNIPTTAMSDRNSIFKEERILYTTIHKYYGSGTADRIARRRTLLHVHSTDGSTFLRENDVVAAVLKL